jgi:hypothetical protein
MQGLCTPGRLLGHSTDALLELLKQFEQAAV